METRGVIGRGPGWLRERLGRHLSELLRLSAPAMASRIGILALGFVDTVMVGHYATRELASLSLANRSVISFLLVVAIGLLMGVIVKTAGAFGKGDLRAAGRVWRRSIPYAAVIGLVMLLLTMPAPLWMSLLAHDPAVARESAILVLVLGLALPGHLLFFCSTAFLEGIRRPMVPMLMLLAANLANVVLNYALVYGHFGAPELGALGSAIATGGVRWLMAGLAVGYIWFAPSMQVFGVREPHGETWADWRHQRRIGYASSVSIGAEVLAFSALFVIAERIGALTLAGMEVLLNVLSMPFMIAVGIGSATAVRVGIAHSREDRADTALAGWTGLLLSSALVGLASLVLLAAPEWLFALHSRDAALAGITIPAISFLASITIFDAGQAVMSMGLRGLGETWWPTLIQGFSYLVVMLPLSWYLGLVLGRGLIGLMEATLVASIVSVAGQSLRFHWLTRPGADFRRSET